MEKDKNSNYINVDRENEALMQPGVVSQAEYKLFAGMKSIYGEATIEAAKSIINAVNGLSIEEANTAIDLARHSIKRISKIDIKL